MLAQRGIFVSFGNASGAVPAFPVLRLIGKSAFVCRPKLLDYTRDRAELDYRANQVLAPTAPRPRPDLARPHLVSPRPHPTSPDLNRSRQTSTDLVRPRQVFGWLASGELKVAVDKYFPLDEAPEGHKYLEAGKSKGKVLYKI